jgi:HPt (histidine-containing phosphotransfer) domain-containing protein
MPRQLEEISKLKSMLGASGAKTVFSAFLIESEPLFKQAVEAIEAGEKSQARALLHKLKGVLGSVMAGTPQQLCVQLEKNLLEDGPDENSQLISELKHELSKLTEAARLFVQA